MTRKDIEKDSERPHYYSQFWLDVAAGRRIIGAPKPNEDEQGDIEVPETSAPHRVGRISSGREDNFHHVLSATNGRSEVIEHPVADPVVDDEEIIEPTASDFLAEDEQDELQSDDVEDNDVPDMDLAPLEDEDEDDEPFDEDADAEEETEEETEEDEDDIGWSGRGRKRNKPARVVKPVARKPKREPRRY